MINKFTAFILTLAGLTILLCGCQYEKAPRETDSVDYLAVKVAGDDNWSILDINTGEMLYKNEFKNRPSLITEDRFFVQRLHDDAYELYDIKDISKPVGNGSYKTVTPFRNGVALVTKKNEAVTIIDREGIIVKELTGIERARPFRNGFSIVFDKDGKAGAVDQAGNIVIRPSHDGISLFSTDGYALAEDVRNDSISNFTLVNRNGQSVTSFSSEKYKPITGFVNGSMAVKKDDKVIYIDSTATQITSAGPYIGNPHCYGFFEHISIFAADNGKYGLITDKGERLIRDKYDIIRPLHDGTFVVKRDEKYGLIDKNDNQLIDIAYMSITRLKPDRLLVKEDENRFAILDSKGKEICKETLADVSFSYEFITVINDKDTQSEEFGQDQANFMPQTQTQHINHELINTLIQLVRTTDMPLATVINDNTGEEGFDMVELWRRLLPYYTLTEEDLWGMHPAQLRLMRNCIFANHNYIFKSPDLTEFYTTYPWYKPEKNDVTREFSQTELYNIRFIKSHE